MQLLEEADKRERETITNFLHKKKNNNFLTKKYFNEKNNEK